MAGLDPIGVRIKREAKSNPPPPLEGGGWGEGYVPHDPLPPTPSLKGRGSVFSYIPLILTPMGLDPAICPVTLPPTVTRLS